jgi:hypothetical protein
MLFELKGEWMAYQIEHTIPFPIALIHIEGCELVHTVLRGKCGPPAITEDMLTLGDDDDGLSMQSNHEVSISVHV